MLKDDLIKKGKYKCENKNVIYHIWPFILIIFTK